MQFVVRGVPQNVADEVRRTRCAPGYGHPAHLEVAAGTGAVPTGAQPNGPEWTPSERPIVRAQAANTAPPVPGRRSAQMQSPRPADELGVEESEFDKPTYLRRGLYAPE